MRHWKAYSSPRAPGVRAFCALGNSKDASSRALILFHEDGPVFCRVDEPTQQQYALEYCGETIFDVDHHGPYNSGYGDMFQASGCMIREPTGWRLNVRPQNERYGWQTVHYNYKTGQLEAPDMKTVNYVIFGKWQIFVGDVEKPCDEWTKMVSFEWAQKQGSGA